MSSKDAIAPMEATNDNSPEGISRRGFIKGSACVLTGMAALKATEAFGAEKPWFIIMERASGMIVGDPSLCVACQRCELACTEFNDGKADPGLTRIKIGRNLQYGPAGALGTEKLGLWGNSLVVQDTCRQCPHPVPCSTACPHNAIIAQPGSGTRVVDAERCVGCRTCQMACPWGMMTFNEDKGKADKCFLCNGKPKCVIACPSGALRYVPWSDRTKSSPPRGAFLLQVPESKAAACASCHVAAPGGPRTPLQNTVPNPLFKPAK